MSEVFQYIIPVLILTLVAMGWMGVQLLAKRMQTKNHIDQTSCCGACEGKETCRKEELKKLGRIETKRLH